MTAMQQDGTQTTRLSMAVVSDQTFFLGIDLGQRESHTAIILLERFEQPPSTFERVLAGDGFRRRYVVRQAERLDLGTPYTDVIARVRGMVDRIGRNCPGAIMTAVVDGTGIGIPVVEQMRASHGVGCRVFPITITSGNTATAQSVPREMLIAKMKMMLETGELEVVAGCRHGDGLVHELAHLTLDRANSRDSSDGAHDDMALALALACWRAKVR